jgi:hypothetical protein
MRRKYRLKRIIQCNFTDLQVLHDSSVYWDDEGLTRETKSRGLLLKWA